MFPQLRLTPARAAFARPGPHATAFPDVNAPMQPSDSLVPFARRSGRPSPAAYPGAQVLFFTAAPVPPPTGATPETFLPRLPIGRLSTRGKTRGSQVPGPSSSCVPWSSTPPGTYRPSPISRCGRCCLQAISYLGHPETCFFRGYLPTAHSLACLRFAESVTVSGARLATGRAGSPFAGRVSHPLDDKQGFMGSSHTPFPLDQPCLVALPPKLIIFNGVLGGARAPHCQERRLQRDRFATTMTILNRSDCFGAARAGSEWPARHAHSSACPNA